MPAAQNKNPQVGSYMKAAKKAAEDGNFTKVIKLLQKASDKRKKTKNPVELVSILQGALSGAAFSLGKKAFNPRAQRVQVSADGTVRDLRTGKVLNPGGDAAQEYADFHGQEPKEVLDMQEQLMKSGHYWAVGDNPELWLHPVSGDPNKWGEPDIWFDPEDGVKLGSNKAGTQLFFVGGAKQLPLDELKRAGHDTSKRFITLGPAHGISYETEKVFDQFKHKTYAHQLGEETGVVPTAIYDKDTGRILLAGGEYHIPGVDQDLGASPGIVN